MGPKHRFCIAPMMDWSDRHCRFFWRRLTRQALLYTEMVTSSALLHGDRDYLLRYHPEEQPLALQLGGSDPDELARCAALAERAGFVEVNLNCGCPSDRVQQGRFGASLMAAPALVADCVRAMRAATDLPVTVKHRIGIDDMEDYAGLAGFVEPLADAGCRTLIVHARKAWLAGLSPKQNREIPPLRYELVYQLKRDFPALEIVINGGITDLDQAERHLSHVDGVMVGRAAYHQPHTMLATVDQRLFGATATPLSPLAAAQAMLPYTEAELAAGTPLNAITRHMLGLFQGLPGARRFRRHLSTEVHRRRHDMRVLEEALAFVQPAGTAATGT